MPHGLVARALELLGQPQQRWRSAARRCSSPLRASGSNSPSDGHALAVIARHLADQRHLARGEARQPGVEDQVARVLVVVVVVDRHADVVQHRRRPQQLALERVAGVQAGRRQLVEELEREPATCSVWAGSAWYAPARLSTRRPADVLEQRRVARRRPPRRLEEHALAQARLRRLDALEPAGLQHRLDHHGAREDQVRPRRLDARHLAALGGRQLRQALDQLVERLARHGVALHAVGRQARRALRGGGEVAHGAADPDEAPAALRATPRRPARRATCSRSALSCLRLARSPGRKRSVMRTAPSGHERARRPAGRRRARAACEPPPRSSATPSASVVELTAAR